MTSNAPMSGTTTHTRTMNTWNNQTRGKYQIDTNGQDAPVYKDEDTSEASDVKTKEN